MKKTILRIVAILITTVMILANSVTFTYAEGTTKEIKSNEETGTITVSGLEAGVKVSLYQLTTVNFDDTAKQPKDPVYAWTGSKDGTEGKTIKDWLTSSENGYSEYADPEEFSKGIQDNTDQVAKFYSALISAIRDGTIVLEEPKVSEVNDEPEFPVPEESKLMGNVKFENCKMGTYLILIENGYRVYTPSVVNLTPQFNDNEDVKRWELEENVNVKIKSTTPTIKKTVSENKDKENHSTGDDIEFTIISDVPTFLESSISKKYTIGDKLDSGMNLKENSIKVYGKTDSNEDELDNNGTEYYELTTANAKNNENEELTFSINFNYENISKYKQIKVTYTANLEKNSSTQLGSRGNKNTAYLEYSNNPYESDSVQTQESSNTVYTYGIEVSKVDKSDGEKKLKSAQFTLSKDGAELKFINVNDVYYQVNDEGEGASETLTTGNGGLLKIYGLDEGTYTLTETKAPDGYNLAQNPVTIEIKDANDEEELDGKIKKNGEETGSEDESGIYKLTFPNTKGFQLPVTGGIGTILFVAGGIVLVGIGLSLLVIVIKRKKNN